MHTALPSKFGVCCCFSCDLRWLWMVMVLSVSVAVKLLSYGLWIPDHPRAQTQVLCSIPEPYHQLDSLVDLNSSSELTSEINQHFSHMVWIIGKTLKIQVNSRLQKALDSMDDVMEYNTARIFDDLFVNGYVLDCEGDGGSIIQFAYLETGDNMMIVYLDDHTSMIAIKMDDDNINQSKKYLSITDDMWKRMLKCTLMNHDNKSDKSVLLSTSLPKTMIIPERSLNHGFLILIRCMYLSRYFSANQVVFGDHDGMDLKWPIDNPKMVKFVTVDPFIHSDENSDDSDSDNSIDYHGHWMTKIRHLLKPLRIFLIGFDHSGGSSMMHFIGNEMLYEKTKYPLFQSQCFLRCKQSFGTRNIAQIMDILLHRGLKPLDFYTLKHLLFLSDFDAHRRWKPLSVYYPYSLFILNIKPVHHWLGSKLKTMTNMTMIMMDKNDQNTHSIELIKNQSMNFNHIFNNNETLLISKIFGSLMNDDDKEDERRHRIRTAIVKLHSYLSLLKYRFYHHSCSVIDYFQNHHLDSDDLARHSLLIVDVEQPDYLRKVVGFIHPAYHFNEGALDRTVPLKRISSLVKKNTQYDWYSRIIDAFSDQLKKIDASIDDDYYYSEYEVSECICQRLFNVSVSYPPRWNKAPGKVSFECAKHTTQELRDFVVDSLASLSESD